MMPVVKVVLPLHCVPARLPVTSWLPAKPDGSLALAAATYGPLNPISLLYLRSPQSCPSSPPHQLPRGKVLWHVRALVFVSTSCSGSADLILATWQLFGRCHLLTASLLSLLLLGNPYSAQLCPVSGCPHPVTQLLLPSPPHISDLCLPPSLPPSLYTCIFLGSSSTSSWMSYEQLKPPVARADFCSSFASHIPCSHPFSLADT